MNVLNIFYSDSHKTCYCLKYLDFSSIRKSNFRCFFCHLAIQKSRKCDVRSTDCLNAD